MSRVRYLVSGSWSASDRIAAEMYNERVNHLHDLEWELEEAVRENARPPRTSLFAIETKVRHSTAALRDRIISETEWCLREHDRLVKAGSGMAP